MCYRPPNKADYSHRLQINTNIPSSIIITKQESQCRYTKMEPPNSMWMLTLWPPSSKQITTKSSPRAVQSADHPSWRLFMRYSTSRAVPAYLRIAQPRKNQSSSTSALTIKAKSRSSQSHKEIPLLRGGCSQKHRSYKNSNHFY